MSYQFLGLFNIKSILLEEKLRYYLTHSFEDKGALSIYLSIYLSVCGGAPRVV